MRMATRDMRRLAVAKTCGSASHDVQMPRQARLWAQRLMEIAAGNTLGAAGSPSAADAHTSDVDGTERQTEPAPAPVPRATAARLHAEPESREPELQVSSVAELRYPVAVTVEKSSFLLTMQRKIGGVHIQHDFLWRGGVRFQKHLDHQYIEAVLPERDLLISVRRAIAQFQAVQGTLAR